MLLRVRRRGRRLTIAALALALAIVGACSRGPRVSDSTYRDAVTAFYVALAAMQTSQDLHARKELDRFVQLVPEEPAGWANLGLLLLRQQQMEEAASRLAKASALAPRSAAIERLQAVAASRAGNLQESVRHWRRAIELDADDLKAPYALAVELERIGGDSEAEAQRLFESIATRAGNLAALIEMARLASKRSDAAALARALDTLGQQGLSWPPEAQARLQAVRQAAQTNPSGATTAIVFLKNVLLPRPEYRSALALVSTPRSEIGEPLTRFIALRNPEPQAAAADTQLALSFDEPPVVAAPGVVWAGAIWMNGTDNPVPLALSGREVRIANGSSMPFPSSGSAAPGPDSVAAADLNYDFRTDLVLAGEGGLQLLRQTEKGTFTPVTADTKLPRDVIDAPAQGAWPADIDTDGDLDLLIARRSGPSIVLRNNGDGTFSPQSPFDAVGQVRGFVWADLDGEGVPDAALLDDQGALRVFLNLRGSVFRERQVPAQFPRVGAIAAADVNNDGIMDVIGVATNGAVTRLSQDASGTRFEAAGFGSFDAPLALTPGQARLTVADLDNNGAGDLVVSTAAGSRLLLAEPGAKYRPAGGTTLAGGIMAAADLDGDGRLELVARTDEGARVMRAKGARAYRWVELRPRAATATGDQRINSFGIGGEVEVRTGLHVQKQIIGSPAVHFGLGDATAAEVARIAWPNGVLQSEFSLATNAPVAANQRLKGSCPWLFAWNGSSMNFITDFIWRSPLGLRINAQATADVQMTEDWVKIRGDQLAPRGGVYDMRITAELWETHFFDLVSLLAIDHPAGTEVFVDERFAVPPPPLGVIATSPVQAFADARDDRGGDVRELVRARDDQHLDFAGRGAYQGVTRTHHVELTLPEDAPRTGPLWLIGQGWIHPTDSSINVALGQGTHPPPTGLSLHVADAGGRFTVARRNLGFPAGKDKTILIDLSGILPTRGPRRLRLETNLEIFWDRLGWAAGRPDVKLAPRKLALTSADLQFRGFSVAEQPRPSLPERPRYIVEGVAPRWRDLEGFHTRFGDVLELLGKVDDRYVIMNAGDELRLAFAEAPPLAAGSVRDFVLVGDGWEKDGDFNTVASRTVLPLPTHASPSYVNGTGRLEDDPIYQRHRADFERYHTRYVSPDSARDALRGTLDSKRP